MSSAEWQAPPAALDDDAALLAAVINVYRAQYHKWFEGALNCNPRLPVEARAQRRIEQWRVLLLLTPWMLARLFVPTTAPAIAVPPDWSAAARGERDDTVIGPAVSFTLLDTVQKAHLNYHPRLGHYLLQPLALAMEEYADADQVFAAWNEVIRTRDENIRKMNRDCPLQAEISRRELFTGRRDD